MFINNPITLNCPFLLQLWLPSQVLPRNNYIKYIVHSVFFMQQENAPVPIFSWERTTWRLQWPHWKAVEVLGWNKYSVPLSEQDIWQYTGALDLHYCRLNTHSHSFERDGIFHNHRNDGIQSQFYYWIILVYNTGWSRDILRCCCWRRSHLLYLKFFSFLDYHLIMNPLWL